MAETIPIMAIEILPPDELELRIEDRLIVMVEPHHHTAPNLHSRVLDAVDLLEIVPPARTFWNFLVSRSDSSFGLSIPTKSRRYWLRP